MIIHSLIWVALSISINEAQVIFVQRMAAVVPEALLQLGLRRGARGFTALYMGTAASCVAEVLTVQSILVKFCGISV